jgi:hypothetical protein
VVCPLLFNSDESQDAMGGDFEFSEICINDKKAVLRVGTFESNPPWSWDLPMQMVSS